MFKNYLKIAVRNISNNRVFSFINLFGLSIGIAGSLLILVYVANELSYENFHKNRKNIYRVGVGFGQETSMTFAGAMPALGPAAYENIPEVLNYTRFYSDRNAKIQIGERTFKESHFFFADSNALKIFTFPLVSGDKSSALLKPNSILITKEIAQKYFDDKSALGKTIKYNDGNELTITGILEDIPVNTQLKCDLIASYSTLEKIRKTEYPWNQFGEDYTYFLMQKNFSKNSFKKKLSELLAKNTNENFASLIDFKIQPLTDIYLKSKLRGELSPQGNENYIYLFSTIAILVLLIACLNFMNLSTARSLKRAKEVGLRKTLGANRGILFKQFLIESFLLTIFAVICSLFLYELLHPWLNSFLGKTVSISTLDNIKFYLILGGLIIFVGLFSGIYPALFLSKYSPVDTLKDNIVKQKGGNTLRRALVVIQFAISIFLIIGTIEIYQQLNFMRNTDLGFDKNNVLLLSFPLKGEHGAQKYSVLKNELLNNKNVKSVSGAYTVPGYNSKEQQSISLEDAPSEKFKMVQAIGVDYGYVNTLGLQIIKGRNFSQKYSTDQSDAILINQSLAKELNLSNPVGTKVKLPADGNSDTKTAVVIGVIKDFHVTTLKEKIEPMFLYINPDRYYNVAVKLDGANTKESINQIKEIWASVFPEQDFKYDFLDQQYDSLYSSEEKTAQLFTIFSVFAIIIASLGLLGLSIFSAAQKRKEIGIRKVLGATAKNVTMLLSKEFTKWVLLANLIAWPAAYFAVNKWLQDFAYRIQIEPWVFVIAGFTTFLISFFTISIQTVKAALANPVNSLRYE